jgi:hypothetical protein
MSGNIALTTDAGGAALTGMQMVLQPAITNKCACKKRNPTSSLSLAIGGTVSGEGISITGGTAGQSTLTVVDKTSELTALGLQNIVSGLKVYRANNEGASAFMSVAIAGVCGNTNKHSYAIWAMESAVDVGNLVRITGTGGVSNNVAINSTTLRRITAENFTPLNADNQIAIRVQQGFSVYFILPALTETMAATAYPVVDSTDAAAAVTFTATDFSYPNPLPLNNWQFRTKIKVDGTPATDMWLWSDGVAGVYYKAADSKFYYKHGGGTEIATAAISVGNTYDLGVKQSSSTGASISLNQVVTTNAAVTANYSPAAILSIGEKGDNTLYFRGRLQQQGNLDVLAFQDLTNANWFSEDI